jgi:HEAT repeat protein
VAARALILLGDYSGFDLLMQSLGADDPARRRQAAAGLGDIGEEEGVGELVSLLDDDDRTVRIAAATSLILIAGLDSAVLAQASVDWAKSALGSEDVAIRSAAAGTLGDLAQGDALPLLAQVVADPDPQVRRAAARSAAKIRDSRAARAVATAAREEKDPEVKESQVVALAEIADPAGKQALTEIASEKGRVGVLASGALLRLGDDAGLDRLNEAMAAHKVELRQAAAESASLAKNPRAVATLTTGVNDRDFRVRFASAKGLAGYQADRDKAVPVLEEGLSVEDPVVQAAAQIALRQFGVVPQGGMPPEEMLAAKEPATRRAAIDAAAALPWDQAQSLLRRAVVDRDLSVRRHAVQVVGAVADDHAEDAKRILKTLVNDGDPITRARAQARLARLLANTAPDPGAQAAQVELSAEDAGKLDTLLAAADEASAACEQSLSAARAVTKEIDERTAGPVTKDEQVDEVQELSERAEGIARKARKTTRALTTAVTRARVAADVLGDQLPQQYADRLEKVEVEAAEAVAQTEEAEHAAARAARRAQAFAIDQTADPALYLTSAKTSLATGQLDAARRNLRRARRLFQKSGEVPSDLYFTSGELYSKMAIRAGSDADRARDLEQARQSYAKVVSIGHGLQKAQAKERLAETEAEIQQLSAPGKGPGTGTPGKAQETGDTGKTGKTGKKADTPQETGKADDASEAGKADPADPPDAPTPPE